MSWSVHQADRVRVEIYWPEWNSCWRMELLPACYTPTQLTLQPPQRHLAFATKPGTCRLQRSFILESILRSMMLRWKNYLSWHQSRHCSTPTELDSTHILMVFIHLALTIPAHPTWLTQFKWLVTIQAEITSSRIRGDIRGVTLEWVWSVTPRTAASRERCTSTQANGACSLGQSLQFCSQCFDPINKIVFSSTSSLCSRYCHSNREIVRHSIQKSFGCLPA